MKTKFINVPAPEKTTMRMEAWQEYLKYETQTANKNLLSYNNASLEHYYNYPLSPNARLRFYVSPDAKESYRIDFVYHKANSGSVILEVTPEFWAQTIFKELYKMGAFKELLKTVIAN